MPYAERTMKNPGVAPALWQSLDGGLWHATNLAGVRGIVQAKEINLSQRSPTRMPIARQFGAVSLFDFGPSSRWPSVTQMSDARRWLDGRYWRSRVAVWLEVDRAAVEERLVTQEELRAWWKESPTMGRCVLGVEVGHRGPVPVSKLRGALIIDGSRIGVEDTPSVRAHPCVDAMLVEAVESFYATGHPHPPLRPPQDAMGEHRLRRSDE